MRKTVLGLALSVAFPLAGCASDRPPIPTTVEHPPDQASTTTQKTSGAQSEPIPLTTSNPMAISAVREGIDLLENARLDDARQQFKLAAELDHQFATAIALWGSTIPGPDGAKKIDEAIQLAANLPEAERLHILYRQAVHELDRNKTVEIARQLVAAAPSSARAHMLYGNALRDVQQPEPAIAEYKKALEINDDMATAYNNIAYVEFDQGKLDDAIAHFKRYAELRPREPNPADSLGEALMGAGRFEEAEQAFQRALNVDYKFYMAWEGIAFSRLYRNDWKGGYDALDHMRERTQTAQGKSDTAHDLAWVQLADGKPQDALRTMDGLELDATRAGDLLSTQWAGIYRARLLREQGKLAQAQKGIQQVLDRVEKNDKQVFAAHVREQLLLEARIEDITLDARMAKRPEADKELAAIQQLAGKESDPEAKSRVTVATGEDALARGDAKAAADAFALCLKTDDWCAWEHTNALDKAGDAAGAATERASLAKRYHRDPVYFYVWHRITAATPAK